MNAEIVGVIEFYSIAEGYLALDVMVKMASISILRVDIINPGRCLVLFSGDLGSVESAMDKALIISGENVHDHVLLCNLDDSVLPALLDKKEAEISDALGLLETTSIVAAIEAADYAVKLADVEIVGITIGVETGGKGLLKLNGSVGDISYAIETVALIAKEKGQLFRNVVIPGPHGDIKRFVNGNQ